MESQVQINLFVFQKKQLHLTDMIQIQMIFFFYCLQGKTYTVLMREVLFKCFFFPPLPINHTTRSSCIMSRNTCMPTCRNVFMCSVLLQDDYSQQSNSIKLWEGSLITYPAFHKLHPNQISQHYNVMQHLCQESIT